MYTTLPRVKKIDSLYLLNDLSQKNFYVANKVQDEMNLLETNSSWIVENIERPIYSKNIFSFSSLNTRSLHNHLEENVRDSRPNGKYGSFPTRNASTL